MTPREREILTRALSTLDNIQVDLHVYSHASTTHRVRRDSLYDYEVLGRLMLGRRMLSELLGQQRKYLLPGEYVDEEDFDDEVLEYVPFPRSKDDEPLTDNERRWMSKVLLVVLDGIAGVTDTDDACRRVLLREIAEVAGYPNLAHYRLLMESEVKPLFFEEYTAHVDFQ